MKRVTPTDAKAKAACWPLTPTRKRLKQAAHRLNRAPREADQVWAKAVKKHDDDTCQRCGAQGKGLDAHHVGMRSRRPDLRHVVSNGKTLCRGCHNWVHANPLQAVKAGLLLTETYEAAQK